MQKLIPIIARAKRVVPLWQEGMFLKTELLHLGVGYFDAFRSSALVHVMIKLVGSDVGSEASKWSGNSDIKKCFGGP